MFALTTSPSSTLLTAGQVAAILKLHVRTIRGYVRSGTLKATRVGKQYRIALSDLETFTGQPVENHDERRLSPAGRVDMSSVFTIEGVTPALASRVTNTLMASAGGPRAPHQSLAVTTAYDVEHDRLRILVASDLTTLRSFLALVDAVLERPDPA